MSSIQTAPPAQNPSPRRRSWRRWRPIFALAFAAMLLWGGAGCGDGSRGSSSVATSTAASSPAESGDSRGSKVLGAGQATVFPEVDVEIRGGALKTVRSARKLQAAAHGYLRLIRGEAAVAGGTRLPRTSAAAIESGRNEAVVAVTRALGDTQARYWPIAALVAAVPSLSKLDLGEGPSSTSLRPDDALHPLAEVAGQLSVLPQAGAGGSGARSSVVGEPLIANPRNRRGEGAATVQASAASTLLPAAKALAQASDAVLRQSRLLAGGAAHAQPTAGDLRGAVSSGLSVLTATAQSGAPASGVPTEAKLRALATVSGLLTAVGRASDGSPQGTALSSLGPSLNYLRWLLTQPALTRERHELLAQEIAWSATNLASGVARGVVGVHLPVEELAAGRVRSIDEALFRARWDLALGSRESAAREVERARSVLSSGFGVAPYAGGAAAGHPVAVPGMGAQSRASLAGYLDEALAAVRSGESGTLAAVRGAVAATLVTAAYEATLQAVREDRPTDALRWAGVRDFGPSAPATDVKDNAIDAIHELSVGKLTPTAAATAVSRDELDTLQRRSVTLVQQAIQMAYLGYGPAQAEAAALAARYWSVLSPIYSQRLGAGSGAPVVAAFEELTHTGVRTPPSLQAASTTTLGALGAFTAAPATGAEQQQRIERLVQATRFTVARLCSPTPTSLRLGEDQQGTAAGPPVFARAINDLRPSLNAADVSRLEQAKRALSSLPGASGVSGEQTLPARSAQPSASARSSCAQASAAVQEVFPAVWNRQSDDGDFERIEQTLSRVQSAASEHAWGTAQAEARQAYAIFDLTPELRLRVVDPGLATKIEVLFWNGGTDGKALFDALFNHAPPRALAVRRAALEQALQQARIVLDVSHSATAVAVNSGIVVLREGLEALLIVSALSAGFVTAGRRWRRPVIAGALAAAPATLVTWALCSALLGSLVGYGLPLQAVLDVLSLAVLAVMLAWFFQKFCWTRFVAKERARHRQLMGTGGRSSLLGPAVGLVALGFTVVYREGFETVLYLQALRVQAGSGAVVEGVLLGILFTAFIGALMLVLRRRLPYRGMIVATAVLVGLLAIIMTGQTVRAVQAAGWLGVTPVHIAVPAWSELWLGIYPSVQTLVAQLVALVAIVLTAVLSERIRARRLRRRMEMARRSKAAARTANGRPATARTMATGASTKPGALSAPSAPEPSSRS